jgi:hypothetical protein
VATPEGVANGKEPGAGRAVMRESWERPGRKHARRSRERKILLCWMECGFI